MLQWLLSQYVRQLAQQRVMEAVMTATQRPERPVDEQGNPIPPPPCDVAVVFALGIEAGGIIDAAGDLVTLKNAHFTEHSGAWHGKNIVVAEVGAGTEAAARGTADLIALHRPAWIISAGFAGALVSELPRGHFLMADSICNSRGNDLSVGFQIDPKVLAAQPKLHVGRLLTVDNVVRTPAEKRRLAEQHRALACDMETFAIAEVCRQAKTRLLSVRIISDAVDDELPPEIERLVQSKTLARQLGAATGAIFKRPSAVKDLWQLREDAIRLSDRLTKFLAGIVEQLV